jgi:uncharacterized membrane protein YidH (DUF202 family)
VTTSRSERGTQPERTSLAWTRTSLAVLANGVLLLFGQTHSALQFVAAGVAAMLALSTYLIGLRRQRILARQPLPDRISPRREVSLTGVAIMALILLSGLSLTV